MAKNLESEKSKTNLLSPAHRFVVPSLLLNESFFQLHDLINQIKGAEGFSPDIENYPFGILTVLGSDKDHNRKIYSDWLIHYFENYEKSQNSIVGTQQDLEHMKISVDTLPGIYIWPRKFIIHSKDNLAMVVLIIHVDGKTEVLENFAAVASSNIFVFREREKDSLSYRVQDICVKAATLPGAIFVHSSIKLSKYSDEKDKHKTASDFFKFLDACKIETVKKIDGTEIPFKEIVLHFLNVENYINAAAINFGKVAEDHAHMSQTRSLSKTTSTSGIDNPHSGNQIPPVTLLESTTCEKVTQATEANNDKKNQSPAQCSQSCATLQDQVEVVLDAWLSKNLTPTNITDMLKCCLSYQPFDSHNVFGELCSLVGIILVYNSQLGNTFDNYVCFAGEEDKNQFHRLAESAFRQAFKTLQSKSVVHTDLTEKILHTATITLHAYYVNENKAIAIHETRITKKLLATLQLEYKDMMVKYFTSSSTRSSIKDINAKVKACILLMAEKVMNFNEKFSYIFKKYFDAFSNNLNQNFLVLTREYPAVVKPKGTFSELNDYIDKYLKQFYTDSLPPLHMLTTEQLIEHHDKVVSRVTSDIEWERRETLLNRLYTHLLYITELAEQQQDIINLTEKTKSNDDAFCLYLTSDWYTLQGNTKAGMMTIQYGTQNCKTPPAVAALTLKNQVMLGFNAVELVKKSRSSLKIHGKLLQLICSSIKDDHEASYLIVEYFKKVKHDVDTCFEGNFISAVIIIPSWVNVQHRIRMRNLARCAGIKKLFLVNENTLLAYKLLCINEQEQTKASPKCEFVITVQVGDTGISVEVFTLKNESQMYQAAASFTCWQVANPVHDGAWNALNPFQGNAAITNPFSPTYPSSDCIGTLEKAFKNSYSQIGCSLENQLVNFCVISEHSDYEHVFNDFLNDFKTWTQIQNFQFRYVLPAAVSFLESPQKLAPSVLSHATSVKYFEVIRQTYLQKYLLVNASCGDLENPSLPLISKEKVVILEKCNKMRDQLSNGSVKVRKLMQKVILECIERAEKAASDVHTTNDMLCLEDQELDELIEEHKFKI